MKLGMNSLNFVHLLGVGPSHQQEYLGDLGKDRPVYLRRVDFLHRMDKCNASWAQHNHRKEGFPQLTQLDQLCSFVRIVPSHLSHSSISGNAEVADVC